MDDDIKSNGWGVKNIHDVANLLNIFQTLYHVTGRLPLANGLLIVPDRKAPAGEDRVNMKNLYEMFRHTKFHGFVSLPFLGVLHYYFDATDLKEIKNTLTELYKNLSYATLSGARDFEFSAVSDLVARISYLIKNTTLVNIRNMERADQENAYRINERVPFVPKTENALDVVIDILDDDIEHKKTTHLNVALQFHTAPTTELETQAVDHEFAKLKQEFDRVNDAATKQKKQTEVTDLVDDVTDEKNLFRNIEAEDIWIEDDLFDNKDTETIIDASKEIIDETKKNIGPFIDFTITDSRVIDDNSDQSYDTDQSEITVDNDEPIETITTMDDNIIIPSTNEININTGPASQKKTHHQAVRVAEKIKKKYRRQKSIASLNHKIKMQQIGLKRQVS